MVSGTQYLNAETFFSMTTKSKYILAVITSVAIGLCVSETLKYVRSVEIENKAKSFTTAWATNNQFVQITKTTQIAPDTLQAATKSVSRLTDAQAASLGLSLTDFFLAFSQKDSDKARDFTGLASLKGFSAELGRTVFSPCHLGTNKTLKTKINQLPFTEQYEAYFAAISKLPDTKFCFDCLKELALPQIEVRVFDRILTPIQIFEVARALPGVKSVGFITCAINTQGLLAVLHRPSTPVTTCLVIVPAKLKLIDEEVGPLIFSFIWSDNYSRWYPIDVCRGAPGALDMSRPFPL